MVSLPLVTSNDHVTDAPQEPFIAVDWILKFFHCAAALYLSTLPEGTESGIFEQSTSLNTSVPSVGGVEARQVTNVIAVELMNA